MPKKPSYIDFDHDKFRDSLKTYNLKGEIGVLSYKYSKKVHPHWKFKTPELAKKSAKDIYTLFLDNVNLSKTDYYKINNGIMSDRLIKKFIKADICKKFLLMGYTRSMRYYYHKSGVKWGQKNGKWYVLPFDFDPDKKISALIFKKVYEQAKNNDTYLALRTYFKKNYHKYTKDVV